MSDIDAVLKSLNNLQKSIEHLTKAPFDPLIRQQDLLTQGVYPKGFDEALSLVKQTAIEPYNQLTSGLLKQYRAMTEPYLKLTEPLTSSLLTFQEALAGTSSLTSAIGSIVVHENYVSVPDTLIPDTFEYEEVDSASSDTISPSVEKISTKHLSHATMLALLAILIPTICWLITTIQTGLSSRQEQRNHDELIAIQKESNRLQAEENETQHKQLAFAEKSLEYLCAIYNTVQEAYSVSSDTDSCSQCVHLQSDIVELSNPTDADESEHFGTESDKSEQR